jgi:hypothetical protein
MASAKKRKDQETRDTDAIIQKVKHFTVILLVSADTFLQLRDQLKDRDGQLQEKEDAVCSALCEHELVLNPTSASRRSRRP